MVTNGSLRSPSTLTSDDQLALSLLLFSTATAVYPIHARKCPLKNAAVVSVAGYLEESNGLGQSFRASHPFLPHASPCFKRLLKLLKLTVINVIPHSNNPISLLDGTFQSHHKTRLKLFQALFCDIRTNSIIPHERAFRILFPCK